MKRILKWSLLGVVVIVIVAIAVVWMNLNRIVRSTVESKSSESLKQKTTLGAANVSLFGGKVGLHNFDIASPAGFTAPQMMQLGGLDVAVNLGDLRGDPVRISSIAINDPKMVIEMQGMEFNIRKFIDSLPAGDETKSADNSKPLKLIIDELQVNGAQVIFRPDMKMLGSIPGLQDQKSIKSEYVLKIPDLKLDKIGTGEGNQNGAAVKEVVTLLVTQLASKAAQSDQLPPEIRQLLSGDLSQITEMLKAKVGAEVNKQVEKVTGDLSKKVPPAATQLIQGITGDKGSDPGKAIEKGIGGLLGGKDKKKPTTR